MEYLSNLLVKDNKNTHYTEEDMWEINKRKENPFLEPEQEESTEIVAQGSEKNAMKKSKMEKELVEFVEEEFDEERPITLDNEKTSAEYQRMLRNLEAHEIVLIIIKQNGLKETEDITLYKKVIKAAYSFLIRFVRNNKANKR